jgi:hypothetical protein
MRALRIGVIFCLLVSVHPRGAQAAWPGIERATQAWNEKAWPVLQELGARARRSYQAKSAFCQKAVLALGASAVVSVSLVGYYNSTGSPGAFKNTGTADEPIWIPEFPSPIVVQQRSSAFFNLRKGALWVRGANKNFGRIDFQNDRIEYRFGKELVAFTDPINPYGRPFSADLPITVQVYDSQGFPIGQFSETTKGDLNATILNVQSQSEWVQSEIPVEGVVWNRYLPTSPEGAEVDPRLLVVLSAYQHLIDEKRE